MPHVIMSATDPRLEAVLNTPAVRPEAVARARQLLATSSWCRAEEVASHLVDCLVGHELP